MRTKHLVLLGVIIMQVCFVQAVHYDLTTLLDQQNELDCENTDFVQMLEDIDSWSEIIELLQGGQLDAEMKQLQELSDFTNEMISATPDDLMEDQQYDEQLEQMDGQLQTIQNQYNGPQRKFLFEQSRQISDQIRRVIESRSFEQKRSQLAMLYGLIEYLLKQISRVQNQYQQTTQPQPRAQPQQVQPSPQQRIKEQKERFVIQKDKCSDRQQLRKVSKQRVVPGNYRQNDHPVPEEAGCDIPFPQQRQPKCVVGSDIVLTSSISADQPTVSTEVKKLKDVNEYGFGFWMRFLTLYPEQLQSGLTDQSYFVAKLTKNQQDGDDKIGDRLLTIFQTQEQYIFSAQHDKPERKEATAAIVFGDIEAVWTYVYYSYSAFEQQAIGFYKQSNSQLVKQVTLPASQGTPQYLRFVLGGQYFDFPGFNGQISRPVLAIGFGTYLINEQEFLQYAISCNPQPYVAPQKLIPYQFVRDSKYVDIEDNNAPPTQEFIDLLLPDEYAVQGWFKWEETDLQENWHTMFRLSNTPIRKQQILLGERVLAAWLGKPKGGQIHFSTYSYANMKGSGNPNAHQYVQHQDQHLHWHFVYFGYSREQRKAYAQVLFKHVHAKSLSFVNVNHFVSPKHYFYFGRERQFPVYSGFMAYLEVFFCKGSYLTNVKPALRPVPTPPPPKKRCVEGPNRIINAKYDKGPVVHVELHKDDLKDTTQYGYGFWFRYTGLAGGQYEGARPDWSLIARLTNKKETPKDIRDGLLTIFQGKVGFFYITANNKAKKLVELAQPFGDIEGVWIYTYFSYTRYKAIAFYQIENQAPITLEAKVTHPRMEQLLFQVGGKDPQNRYYSFNGQFHRPVLRLGSGSFFDTLEEYTPFCLSCNPQPQKDCSSKGLIRAVSAKASQFNGNPVNSGDRFGTTEQYSVQGWFKWNGKTSGKDQLLFRLTSTLAGEDALNFDTLSCYFDTRDQTLNFYTYTYTDQLGSGNPEVRQIVEGKTFVKDWFHIYFAYSRKSRQADVIVEHSQGKGALSFKNVNHYVAPSLILYYGKDQLTDAFQGFIQGLNLFACDITYQPTPKPVEDCTPMKDPICLGGDQYENVSLTNIDNVVQELEKRKQLMQDKQFVLPTTQCFCFPQQGKRVLPQRQEGLLEIYDDDEEPQQQDVVEV
ncbi:unnamed protein product [Paramecium octaurelia]|uniref:Uncharacterized protein n=1 Tax=Paramecium octaurelia TaxID=43137 RepID=A0A8S1TTE2_PAROT|nr:unnamed protein product [Paramecium octaurelia]